MAKKAPAPPAPLAAPTGVTISNCHFDNGKDAAMVQAVEALANAARANADAIAQAAKALEPSHVPMISITGAA